LSRDPGGLALPGSHDRRLAHAERGIWGLSLEWP
jgi:hypothetical protein